MHTLKSGIVVLVGIMVLVGTFVRINKRTGGNKHTGENFCQIEYSNKALLKPLNPISISPKLF